MFDFENYRRILGWFLVETTILMMFLFSFISNTFLKGNDSFSFSANKGELNLGKACIPL